MDDDDVACAHQIEDWARQVIRMINRMQDDKELPAAVGSFDALHDHFDANVGWSDEMDTLPAEVWQLVTVRVSQLLSCEVN
jgi:hypothetical protein